MRRLLRSYGAVVAGLIALLIGVGATGTFLAFAGEGATVRVVVLGAVATAGVGGGLAWLVVVFHRRGGLLRGRVTDEERAVYRHDYRGGDPEQDNDSSRTRRV